MDTKRIGPNLPYAYEEADASPYDRSTLAAIFDSRGDAKVALHDLHDAGFHKVWMGVARAARSPLDYYDQVPGKESSGSEEPFPGAHQVETSGGGIGQALARFFGEISQRSLHEALMNRGVPESDALALDHRMHDGGAIITVLVHDRYDEALQILRRDRGDVAPSQANDPISVDAPVFHEEQFVQRAPVADATVPPIASDATSRIPLMRDHVVVDKRTLPREPTVTKTENDEPNSTLP